MSAREVAARLLDGLAARDLDAVTSTLAERVTTYIPAVGIINGTRTDAAGFFADLLRAFPDLRITVKNLIDTGDAVTAQVKVEGTQADTYVGAINQEKHLDIDEAWHFAVTDGTITGFEGYWCQQQVYRRLGVKRLDHIALV